MIKSKSLLAACIMTACSFAANAGEWQPIGAKGVAMGGAQVAIPEGSQSVLVNPAALAKDERFDMALPISVMVGSEGDIIESLDGLEAEYSRDIKPALDKLNDGTANNGTAFSTVSKFITETAKNKLDKEGQGVLINANGALTARWKRFGFSAGTRVMAGGTVKYDSTFSLSSAGGSFFDANSADAVKTEAGGFTAPVGSQTEKEAKDIETNAGVGLNSDQIAYYVDQIKGGTDRALTTEEKALLTAVATNVNAAPAVVAGDPTTAGTTASTAKIVNDTGLIIRGIQIQEFAVAYGFSFLNNKLHIAPSLKIMKGETFASSITLTDTTDDNKDIADELDNDSNTVSSTEFTLDIGVLYQVSRKFTLGLMGKDLTSPSFEIAAGYAEIELSPSLRLGSAYEYSQKPGWRGVLAADLDLIESESAVLIGADSQQFALGISQELMGWLSIRAGLNKNLAGESDGLVYSAGLGIQISKFYLDVAGQKATDEVTVDGDDFPTRGGVGVTIGWNMNF